MKLKSTILALAAMTGAASASYTIISTSVVVNGTTYDNGSLSAVNLGTFRPTDMVIFGGNASAAIPVYRAEILKGGIIPTGATNSDNYIHAANNDGAKIRIIVDGATVLTQTLTQTITPAGAAPNDKGVFGWGALPEVDLVAAVFGAGGTHTVSYEIDFTFSQWDGINRQISPPAYKPMTANATFTVVPEPSSAALLGIGALGLFRRRRK